MIGNQKVIAIIPARGGSKGIKDKNIVEFLGKPLIAHSIEAALGCPFIDEVIVSTDSERIARVAKDFDAKIPFMRPGELASDTATTACAIKHALDKMEELGQIYDVLVLLQPTSPLRTSEDITAALKRFEECGEVGLVSISEVDKSPILMRTIDEGSCYLNKVIDASSTIRRQDMPKFYQVDGSIYINKVSEITSNFSFNDNPSFWINEKAHAIDIDEPIDLLIAENIARSL